ncbi:hypothetical protein A2Z23_01690 [Candidatus Curtissbacteria bacterium RBG_16_39_7]|uniref:NAD-dependent epimerase/dehydratase domain-containing protein n=1 Tax=Candidatus Curtissbacteria bacterium RBG_16_39_7 TaxID=1797707 RepID=A0A1F5G4Z2_9BACT|nr:MAG: hypothetical protein A2Z23_01690 [Candidatus Curtissbacteria bacterium RBG_16_39_7]
MKVLVTGGAGFIGSHTVDALLAKGHEVKILDSLQERVHPFGKPSWVPKEAEFINGDVSNRDDLIKALGGVKRIFHLAAYQDYLPDFSTFIHTNTESTALIFELILEKKLPIEKIVFASSQAVCGEGKYKCPKHGVVYPHQRTLDQLLKGDWEVKCPKDCKNKLTPLLIDEETISPVTTYGISKLAIEHLALLLGKKYNIPTVCLRYTYAQGPRNSFYNAYSGIMRISVMRALHGKPPIVYEDGAQRRDFINIADVVNANILAMEAKRADFQVFNVGGGHIYTVLEFVKAVCKITNPSLQPEIPGMFRVGDTRHTVDDISKLEKLGWKPEIPIEQSIKEYVNWVKTQPHFEDYYRNAEQDLKRQGVLLKAKIKQ